MKIAINTSAMTNGDLDFSAFEELGETTLFGELPRDELKKLVADCDALIVNKVIVDADLLNCCPRLKYVAVFATGYNVVDVDECKRRGITVCNVPGYSTRAVSQHVFALLLALLGKVREYSASVNAGDWIKSESFCYFPFETHELCGKTFGVLGYGNIGGRVAKIAEAFGAVPLISTRNAPENCPYETVGFEELLERSDILSLHCPLTRETAKIIDEKAIARMKTGAILINTARGGLVDEVALRRALESGKLYGACLDTLSEEPMRADNPLFNAPNCIITPHIAWVPLETRKRLLDIAVENLRKFMQGNPQNVVTDL